MNTIKLLVKVWLFIITMALLLMGVAMGAIAASVDYTRKDCHPDHWRRWEYFLPTFRLGCVFGEWVTEAEDWNKLEENKK